MKSIFLFILLISILFLEGCVVPPPASRPADVGTPSPFVDTYYFAKNMIDFTKYQIAVYQN